MILPSLKASSFDRAPHWLPLTSPLNALQSEHEREGKIALYDAHNLDHCPWPLTPDGQHAQKMLTPLIQQGVSHYIENVQTDLRALVFEELVFPITINNAEYDNAYVCSPYSYFISYARESLDVVSQPWLSPIMDRVLVLLGGILRYFDINKVIVINNWLYSTNLYPRLQPRQLTRVVRFLQGSFPDHALVFRSIDPYTSPICYALLEQMGFKSIATRQIFFIDPHDSTLFQSRLFKSDLKLLENSGYEILNGEEVAEAEIPRLLKLYRNLYIDKYSDFNPKFNCDFIRLTLREKLLNIKVLKKNGSIDGVVGYVQRNGKMYCPLFGYDRLMPKEAALYRLLCTVLMLEAYEHRLLFHQSAGASTFKKIRKAHSCIEHMAVYDGHMKISRRIPWTILKGLYNSIGVKYMERY